MDTNEARIRLAEAMGWSQVDVAGAGLMWKSPDNETAPLPDPFTDANDDYAVLEWMREHVFPAMGIPSPDLHEHIYSYTVGDYARAYLKLLERA